MNTHRKIPAVILVVTFFLQGCATYYGPSSPYSAVYEKQFEGVVMPTVEEIAQNGSTWVFSKSSDEVWEALKHVVTQFEGVLDVQQQGEEKQMLFVHGQEMRLQAPKFKKNVSMVFHKFLDVWLAVHVAPEEGGEKTRVTVAYVSPEGKTAPADSLLTEEEDDEDEVSLASSTVQSVAPLMVNGFQDVEAGITEKPKSKKELKKMKDAAYKWRYVPQETINEFFYYLGTQLYGPERWRAKLENISSSEVQSVLDQEDLLHNTGKEEYADVVEEAGNWTSTKLRRTLQVVYCPIVTSKLQQIADRIKKVAGQENRDIKVYVVASPEINAFVLPNGDVFVCSGMLEMLDTPDQIAAVIGHELDHVFEGDTLGRLHNKAKAINTATTIAVIGGVAGGAAGAAVGVAAGSASAAAANVGTSVSAQMMSSMAQSTVVALSGVMASSFSESIIAGYSEDVELRADYNGAKYMEAIGYDIESQITLFEKLDAYKVSAEEREESITSGFINCKPGLSKRIEKMRELIASRDQQGLDEEVSEEDND